MIVATMSKLPDHNDWVRSFYVSNPTLHKKGYTIYKVVSKIFPKNSVEAASQVVVWKRYSDFLKLYKALFHLYQGLHLKGTFPKFPKASYFGRFDEETVEERRKSALCLLEFAAQYPVLFNSQVFVKFFEHSQECHDDVEEEISALKPPLLAPPSNGSSSYSCAADLAGGDCSSDISWRPPSAADALSLDSRTTEEEADFSARSTATEGEEDDRLSTSRQTSPAGFLRPEIAEFDPILQREDSDELSSLSNAWILSAADACACLGDESTPTPAGSAFVFPSPVKETVEEDTDDWTDWTALELNDETDGRGDTGRSRHDSATSFSLGTPVSPLDVEGIGYLHEATSCAAKAHACEANGDFVGAFSLYKSAVSSLLEGVQKDSSASRREAVRRKTAQYLARAEQIYEHRLARRMEGERRWSLSKGPEVLESGVPPSGKCTAVAPRGPSLRGPIKDLAHYKVIGVVGTVLLVLDMRQSQTVVIKVLHKSPGGSSPGRPSVVPQGVPHMAQLLCLYETDCSYYLVLEYAPGGRLWDCLAPYLNRRAVVPPPHACQVPYAGSPSLSPMNSSSASPCLPSGEPAPVPPSECDFAITCNESQTLLPVASGASILDTTLPAKGNDPPSSNQPLLSPDSTSQVQIPTTENSLQLPCIAGTLQSQGSTQLSKAQTSCGTQGLEQTTKSMNILTVNEASEKLGLRPSNITRNQVAGRSLEDGLARNNALNVPASKAASHSYSGERSRNSEALKDNSRKSIASPKKPVKRSLSSQAAEAFRELDNMSKQLAKPSHLPEACIRLWAAEIVMALGHLHRLGIVRQDLCPHDVLLGEGGHVVLTYCCAFNSVDHSPSQFARENQYCAPEINNLGPVTPACDWWSLGALLYELFAEAPLILSHPGGITPTTRLHIPAHVSAAAADLLDKLLAYYAHQRLGYGPTGTEDVKCHPFFATIDWTKMSRSR
ncbi:ribosomal protein S6 kinase-like 1 isoform X1 [Amblyomma americanum]